MAVDLPTPFSPITPCWFDPKIDPGIGEHAAELLGFAKFDCHHSVVSNLNRESMLLSGTIRCFGRH